MLNRFFHNASFVMPINWILLRRCTSAVVFAVVMCGLILSLFMFSLRLLGEFVNEVKGSRGWRRGFFETTGSIVHMRTIGGGRDSFPRTEYCAGVEGVYGDTKELIDTSAPPIIFGDLSRCFDSRLEAEKMEPKLLAWNKGIFKCWAATEKVAFGLLGSQFRLKKKKPAVHVFDAVVSLTLLCIPVFFLLRSMYFRISCSDSCYAFSGLADP